MTPGTRLLAIVLACAALSPGAAADDPWELWPITVNRNWRFELYLAHQADNLPNVSRLNAFGVVLKAYY